VLNLDGVPLLDSTGLGMLVAADVTASRQERVVELAHVTARNRELFGSIRLDDLFAVFDSEEVVVATVS
jgi:anti-anti-sigma regulatory factor